MEDYESVLLVKNEVYVYKIPPRTTNRGFRAADWKLDSPEWTGRMRLVSKGKECILKLEDKITGELFAKCPIDKYPGIAVEAVMDSSRYFVIRLQDDSGNDQNCRAAFIGIGFADRGDSFDLNVALQDHFKWLQKSEELEKEGSEGAAPPQLDLSFKEGQTITINMNIGKKAGSSKPKPRAVGGASGTGILPPPPGGVKLPAPPSGIKLPPAATSVPSSNPLPPQDVVNTVSSSSSSAIGNLLDLSPPSDTAPSLINAANNVTTSLPNATGPADPWGDFTGAPSAPAVSQPQPNQGAGGAWIQF